MNGITACKWDSVIPFNKHIIERVGKKDKLMYEDEFILYKAKTTHESIHYWQDYFKDNAKDGMWDKLNKLIKPNGAIVLFGSEPFSSALRMSNIKNYKYDWVWDKKQGGHPLNAKKQPLKIHEQILVFNKHNYHPVMRKGKLRKKGGLNKQPLHTGKVNIEYSTVNDEYYPTSIIEFSNANKKNKVHNTQKPVALMEYLIKTYTNEGELVLDFTAGSFSTIVACLNTKRNFIGIELDDKYFEVGSERVKEHLKTLEYTPKIIYNQL